LRPEYYQLRRPNGIAEGHAPSLPLKTANGNFGGTEAPLISTLDKRGRKVLATIISAANKTFIVGKQIVSTSVRLRMLNCMMSLNIQGKQCCRTNYDSLKNCSILWTTPEEEIYTLFSSSHQKLMKP